MTYEALVEKVKSGELVIGSTLYYKNIRNTVLSIEFEPKFPVREGRKVVGYRPAVLGIMFSAVKGRKFGAVTEDEVKRMCKWFEI